MNPKLCGIILLAIFLLELTAARTVRHQETIIKSNGDKIVRSWTTYEGDDTELNKNYDFTPNIFEDDKDGAADDNSVTSMFFNNFDTSNAGFGKPGYHAVDTNKKVLERKLISGMGSGQFEEAWDLEPDYANSLDKEPETEPESAPEPEPLPEPEPTEPNEEKHNWKSLLDLAKQPNSPWKPIDSTTYVESNYNNLNIDDTVQMQPKPINSFSHTFNGNSFESWPMIVQEPTVQETPYNINGVRVTQTYSSNPTLTQTQIVKTNTYSGPQTVVTGNWPNVLGGWTITSADPKQNSWEDVSTKPNSVEEEKTAQKPANTYYSKPTFAVQPAKYPNKSLDDLLKELFEEGTTTTTTTTTTATPTTANPKRKPIITTINIADLPIAEILHNGQPIDEVYLKTLPEHLRPVENTLDDIRRTNNIHNIPMTQENDFGAVPLPRPSKPSRTTPPPTPRRTTPSTTTTKPKPSTTTTPKPQATSPQSNIAKFLKKVDLSMNDVLFHTAARTITKTIIDDNGDILTATFVLSSVKDMEADRNKAKNEFKPLK